MIKFGPYWYIDWKSVKQAWKRGVRDTPVGVPELPCEQYAVGDTFLLYPNQSARPDGDICPIPRDGIRHNYRTGAAIYGNAYCSTLNPF